MKYKKLACYVMKKEVSEIYLLGLFSNVFTLFHEMHKLNP